ncbi:ATP phosphoribosyltransferase regulatory subunit [[Clostridium] polysaccharolyticum]|uniref:ATP phosphoribosyltransferase regulatory subunit n=1 Tax=[Clostridium] polysaccharolyticum TaxID=29364 RepID=A0A1I0AWX4_9FIRM|nr:ATP phosphoribosyltransferase regulatory subunit [[Clostridium] polysaccharolyticum]SES98884.1 ATP phosphoribosyltransferase regulatory subunit [[Clostridium] polysaccharolyticum]
MSYKFSEHKIEQSVLHIPEGVRDIYNGECKQKLSIEQKMHQVLHSYGFTDIQTPMFEFFDVFSKERGTIASREMYKFFDRGNNTLVLRPDMTPAIARCVGKYFKEEELPLHLCYKGSTFINTTSYQGKLKETTQLGAELINDGSVDADAEMIALTIECLRNAGLEEFQVEIGHAQFLNGIIEEADFDEMETEQLKELIQKKNVFGVEELAEGKKLPENLKELFFKITDMYGNIENISNAKTLTSNELAIKAIERLEELYAILDSYGVSDYITFDLGLLSKYNYYTGIIFKAYTYGTGEPIVKGGRYDNLMKQFGKEAPAIGLAIVVDQLMTAVDKLNEKDAVKEESYLVLYENECRKKAIDYAKNCRLEGKEIQLTHKDPNFTLEDYKAHAKRMGIAHILYMKNESSMEQM